MNYTVVWKPAAEQELADLWTAAADRAALAAAADSVDRLLGQDPGRRGESRSATVRILFVAPLGVQFKVVAADRTVEVLRVWRFGRGPGERPGLAHGDRT